MKNASAAKYGGRPAGILAIFCAFILVAGCQAPPDPRVQELKVQDPKEVAARFVATQGNISDYTGTMVISDIFQPSTPDGEKLPKVTRTMAVKVLFKKPYHYRFLYYNHSSSALLWEEILNRDAYWLNYSSENQALRENVTDPRVLGILSYDFQSIAKEILKENGSSFTGTQTQDGRMNYGYHAEFENPRTYYNRLVKNATLWIDGDTLVLNRMEIYDDGGELLERIDYQDIRINTGLSDQDFAFSPPAGVTVSSL